MKIAITTDTHYGYNGDKTRKNHEKFLISLAEAMALHDCKLLCHTGDWATHKHSQLAKTFEQFRQYIKQPILTVFGNHDYWNVIDRYKPLKWEDLVKSQNELLLKFDITHVGENPVVIDNILFAGYNGWYANLNPPSNDLNFMPKWIEGIPTHEFLNKKSHNDLNKLLYSLDKFQYEKAVCLTHFPPFIDNPAYADFTGNPSHLPFLKESFNVLIVGHSHRTHDYVDEGLRIINSGAEYHFPRFIIVEI